MVKDVNSAFEHLFLRSRESVIGKNTLELSLYCDETDRTALIDELMLTGKIDSASEVWMRRGDGSKVLVQFASHTFTLAGDQCGDVFPHAPVCVFDLLSGVGRLAARRYGPRYRRAHHAHAAGAARRLCPA
jgi:PAS domain-containing protein